MKPENEVLSLKRLRLVMLLLVASPFVIMGGSAVKSTLARLLIMLAGIAALAGVVVYMQLHVRCPHCGTALRIYMTTLLDGEVTYCSRCGHAVEFQ